MKSCPNEPTYRYCARDFSPDDINLIRRLIAARPPRHRADLSRRVCDELGWVRPDGQRKDMSCRVAMLRMDRDGLINLPAPLTKNGNGRIKPRSTAFGNEGAPVNCSTRSLGKIVLQPVSRGKSSSLWNELIERYHYLGYTPLAGAQLRYLVYGAPPQKTELLGETGDPVLLAALSFSASAWMTGARDNFIGWNIAARKGNLHLVVNNSRFLILPWVNVKNLASKILGLACRQLQDDWLSRYNYAPVLLETFVERDRFRGTCYRAANWIKVGETQGRGKSNKRHIQLEPIKDVYVYPLKSNFREILQSKD